MCTLLKQLNLFSLEFGLCRLVLAGLPEPHRLCQGRKSAEIFCSINPSEPAKAAAPHLSATEALPGTGLGFTVTPPACTRKAEDSVTTRLGTKQELFLPLMPAEDMCIHSAIADLWAALFTQFFCPTPVEPIFLFLNSLTLSGLAQPHTNTPQTWLFSIPLLSQALVRLCPKQWWLVDLPP